jgi:uncharacterized OB-fold protein
MHPYTEDQVVSYVFPKRSVCPECNSGHHCKVSYSRHGRVVYRRCQSCRYVYSVPAIGAHIDRGGDQSELITF